MLLWLQHTGDEQKHSWYLEEVEVVEVTTNETYVFPCKNWLSLYVGDGKVKRQLKAHKKEIYQTGMCERYVLFYSINDVITCISLRIKFTPLSLELRNSHIKNILYIS